LPVTSTSIVFVTRYRRDVLDGEMLTRKARIPYTYPVEGDERSGTLLVAFSVTPIGTSEAVGEAVADAVRVVRDSGLPNRTDAMFTTIEGDWDEVMAVVKLAVDAVAARAPRVSVVLKADIRPGVTGALTAKVETVERYLRG
jgi:uncharacterized protein (TIGR00106 family)